jgi:CBS domain containing-hemolysin-like protein
VAAEYLLPILIIAFLILLNGLFVAAEFAIIAAPKTRITQLADNGSIPARHILKILEDPAKQNLYLTSSQFGITIASLGLGSYGEEVLAEWFLTWFSGMRVINQVLAHTLASIIAVALLTYLHVVLGEMIPKSIALQSAESTVIKLNSPMTVIQKIFAPIIWLLNGIANQIVKMMGIPPADIHSRILTPAEIEYVVDESSAEGLLQDKETLFIENILDLPDRSVAQVMTPRTQMVALSLDQDRAELMKQITNTLKSRFPVYQESIDEIIGILHIKDLARSMVNPDQEVINLENLLHDPVFIPDSLSVEKALKQFRSENIQIAIVIGEYGETAGILTLEDLIEEVVGEIQDEFDQEITPIEVINQNKIRVRGDVILDEINQHYDLDLDHPDAYTIGGLVMSLLERIPQPGDHVAYQEIDITVEAVERLAVQSVIIYFPPEKVSDH